jgi:hypothetical protein
MRMHEHEGRYELASETSSEAEMLAALARDAARVNVSGSSVVQASQSLPLTPDRGADA